MEEKVLEILKNVFVLKTVDTTCSQQNLVVELESEFDVSLEPEEIGEMRSFDDIVRLLKRKGV